MTTKGLFVKLYARPGKADELKQLLTGALTLANQESDTVVWFALQFDATTFGIFDAFAAEAGRQAHLNGPIAAALMAQAPLLLAEPPNIESLDVLAAKVPG